MMRARASGCTVACLAQGACRAPKTGGARLTEALKAATCSSTFAHAHKGRGMRCSSTQKSAGPAGRRALREARAAPDRASAELLDSVRALDCSSFTPQFWCWPELAGCRAGGHCQAAGPDSGRGQQSDSYTYLSSVTRYLPELASLSSFARILNACHLLWLETYPAM